MTEPLRILLIDDDEDYFVIARDLLRECGRHTLEWRSDFERGLESMCQGGHDVCLVDYRLGGRRNGVDLLRAAQQRGCRAPAILFTGTGDHAVDMQAMKAGAVDYLDKQGVTAAVLERAIRYAVERARKDAALRKSHEDMLAILDRMRMGIAMTDADGRLTFVSRSGAQMFGLDAAGVIGRQWDEVFPLQADDRQGVLETMSQAPAQRTKRTAQVETASGQHLWTEVEVHDDPRDPQRKILFFYDVTEVQDLRWQLGRETRFHDLVGASEPMRAVYRMIAELAKVDATVLIEGETGTGKELVARAIHFASHRKDKPFVVVNCAGLTDSLLGSQLFGHKRGAFTGAVADQAGVFETADGGTIFLDEIGDISAGVQSNLLRVLQEKEITRLGETQPRKIDVRIVAATHRDLRELVDEGRFRLDLLYRIRVARVILPPLRERRGDIPLLAETFLRRVRAKTGKQVLGFSHEALGLLLNHPWPGNVRELQSAVEFAVIRCQGETIGPGDLPPEVLEPPARVVPAPSGADQRERVLEALRLTDNNRVAAAKLLGVSRSTLYRRLEELGISDA